MDHSRALGALLLVTLAPASWAASGDTSTKNAAAPLETWQDDAGSPEDFQDYVDRSRRRQGGPADPVASASANARPRQTPPSSRPRVGPQLDRAAVPAVGRSEPRPTKGGSGLPAAGLAGALGLALGLFAWQSLQGGSSPKTPTAPPSPEPAREPTVIAQEPAARTAPEAETIPEPFIDTRMPVPTWRAISQKEQQLIEAWDRSREKALGLASLEEWLDRKGGSAGVDIERLKAKLRRDV